jgi:type II secretory pathway component PulK
MARQRRGSVLIVVTMVLLMVSLAVVGLLSMVRLDYQATKMRGREMLLENALQVGESYVAAIARQSREQRYVGSNLTRSAELFANQPLLLGAEEAGEIHFSVVIPAAASERETLSYGVINESAKLNLHRLLEWDKEFPGRGERALLELPGMQPEQAASILDWMDADSLPRLQGGEFEQYQTEARSELPTNAVPANLETLANVRLTSLTDWMDEANPVFNPAARPETTGRRNLSSAPQSRPDSGWNPSPGQGSHKGRAAGISHRAWEHYLTVHSRERNESFDGQPRIFLNDEDLAGLHQRLSQRLNQAIANFVVLYRQFGPGLRGRPQPLAEVELNFMLPGKFKFASELDLVGAAVNISLDGVNWRRVDSPLKGNRAEWAQLQFLMDQLTVDSSPIIVGRVNIDEAPREVLLAIPGMDQTMADRILAARFLSANGRVAHVHPTWLLEQGIVELTAMKSLIKYCTTGGDVFQAQIVAYIPDSPWCLREIVAIDGAEKVPFKLYCKDRRDSVNPHQLEH